MPLPDGELQQRRLAVVATDGGQGYSDKSDAKATLTRLLAGEYQGDIADAT